MNLDTIKSRLESLNYHTQVVSDTLIIGTDPEEIPELPGGRVFRALCSVEIHGNKIMVEYGQASITQEEKFSSEAGVVDFIRKTFPV